MTSATVRGAKRTDYAEPRRLGLVFFALDVVALYGLCAYGSQANVTGD